MKKVYRAHPLMILSFTKPFWFVLILPIAKAALQYLTNGKITDIFGLEIPLFAAIVLLAIARCVAFRLVCEDDAVIVRSGIFIVKRAKIKISKLSSVKTEQNPIDYLFRAVTYSVNTEAGARGRSDFKFKLSVRDSKQLSALLYGEPAQTRVHFSALKVAVMAATTSSAFMGILIGVPVINKAGKLFGVGLNEILLNEINNVSSKFENYFPPIVNTVSLIFLLAYLVSFIYSFFKYINFKVLLSKEELEVRSGFFTRIRTAFKKKSINNVLIVQTPLMLIFRRYAMKVSVGGFGESKSESQIIVPSGRHSEIEREFSRYFPFLAPDGRSIHAERSKMIKNRFLFWPVIYLSLVLVISVIFAVLFTEFSRLILFSATVALAMVFYYAYICMYEYKHGEIKLGKNVFAQSTWGFRTCELYCPRENIGQIKITRFGLDMLQKTCRVRLTVCSEGADTIRVRHLNHDTVISEFYSNFEMYE